MEVWIAIEAHQKKLHKTFGLKKKRLQFLRNELTDIWLEKTRKKIAKALESRSGVRLIASLDAGKSDPYTAVKLLTK